MSKGFYLAPRVYVDRDGDIWKYVDGLGGLPGLGITAGTWTKIGEMFAPIIAGVGTRLAGGGGIKAVEVAPPSYNPGGANLSASGAGIFGNIDTTTILMVGGLALGGILLMKK